MKYAAIFIVIFLSNSLTTALAGEADVLEVCIFKANENKYDFKVTVKHTDTGWNHYADKWDILDEDNNILGTRVLHHPHVNEQPFTRSLSGVKIPSNIKNVKVRAHDSVHEYGGKIFNIELP